MKKLNVKAMCVLLSAAMCMQTFSVVTFAQEPVKARSLNTPETPAVAVEEVKSLREANVKHFRMSDGTYTAASYDMPVHYNDGDGWQDIDNTLSDATDAEENTAVYENKDNPLKVKFAKKSNSNNILKLQQGSYKLTFSLLGDVNKQVEAQRESIKDDNDITTLENTESRVTYENILNNVDIEYVLTGTKLKENIIIRKKLQDYTFKYEIKANGLTMSLEDNVIIARDNDKTVFCFPAPFMFDAGGEISDAVSYSLEKSGGKKYILTITADRDWMNSPEREFPVTVDPTVQIPEINNDTFYYAVERNNEITHYAYGVTHINNALRYSSYIDGASDISSLYMKIDLPYLDRFLSHYQDPPNSVAYGAKVVNATLNLSYNPTVYSGSEANDATYAVYRNTSTWRSNFTYSNKPRQPYYIEDYLRKDSYDIVSYNPSTGEEVDREEQPVFTADITHLVNDWYTGAEVNNGIYITHELESQLSVDIGHRIYYHDSLLYPVLAVSYICSVGIENYFTYTQTDLDGLGTGYVNHLTGALNYSFTDTASGNDRNGAAVSHMYNDEFTKYDHLVINDTPQINNVGRGFKLNIQQAAYYDTAEDMWIHMDADETYHYYHPKKESFADGEPIVYVNEEGLGSELIPDEDSILEDCIITYKSGTKYVFEQELLKKITDKNNNTIEIAYAYPGYGYDYYPVQVKEILSDNQSRITTLEWTDNGNKLSKITAPDGSVVTYTYDSTDEYLLKEVNFSSSGSYTVSGAGSGTKLSFTYDTVNGIKVLATAANSSTGRTTEFTRNSGNDTRVEYIHSTKENASVERTDFEYNAFSTTVHDRLGDYPSINYIFNKQGQTVYISDDEGNSKKYEYSEKHASKNKISFESNLRRVPGNILKNGNFQTKSLQYWSHGSASYDSYKQMVNLPDNEYISQLADVSIAGNYTFSAVIDNSYGADIVMRIEDESGRLVKSLKVGPTDGPETKQLTAYLNAKNYIVRIRSEHMGCYIQSAQLARGTTAEEFNLLQNSEFYYDATGWKKTGFVDTEDYVSGECELVGNYKTKKMLSQTVDVDDAADTVYVFGAMVKSDCLANRDNGDGTDTCVAITLELDYGNGEKDYKTVFCEPKTGANYVNLIGTVKTPYNVDKLTIYLKNLYNYGSAKFDNVYIFRDSAGIYYNYDDNGNVTLRENESGSVNKAAYNEHGDIIRSIDTRNLTTLYEYDSNRNLISTESPTGIYNISEYDSYGNVTSSYLSKSGTTLQSGSTVYDANGMYVTQTTDAFGHATDYDVNSTTLKTSEIRYGKPSAQSDRYNYRVNYNYYNNPKADGGTVTGTGPVQSIYASYEGTYDTAMGVSFEYDKGELSKIKRQGYNYAFTKDYTSGNESLVEATVSLPYNFRSSTFITNSNGGQMYTIGKTLYDAGGNLTATVYGNSNYHTYVRDPYGRITVKNTLRDQLSYTYNSKGLLANVSSEYNNTANMYSYDFAGRMSVNEFYDYNNDVSLKHKYTYDAQDMLTSVKSIFTKENGQRDIKYTTYEYDREGRISAQDIYREGSGSIYLVPKIRYNYNDIGLLTSAVYSGANQINLYTPITRGITYKTVDGNPNKLSSLIDTYDGFTYTYDNVGNIKSVSGSSKHNATYIYDETNQLTNASGYYDTERFEYDYNGNITKYYNTYSEHGTTTEYVYTYHYDNSWKDRLTSITNGSGQTIRSYMYGDNYSVGSTLPTSDGRFEFEWDGRMLTRARRLSDYTVIDYRYDADGNGKR